MRVCLLCVPIEQHVDPPASGGCDGGYTTNAWQWWRFNGIVTGGNYESSQVTCPLFAPVGSISSHVARAAHRTLSRHVTTTCLGSMLTAHRRTRPRRRAARPARRDTTIRIRFVRSGEDFLLERLIQNDLHFGENVYTVSKSVAKIQFEIMLNGPVEALFSVYQDFFSYKSGRSRSLLCSCR